MHCRLLKYLINTIKTRWQKTAVTVHPQLAEYPEKGPSGGWGAWAHPAVTVWPQGIIRLPWQSTSSPSGKTKGHSRISQRIRLGSNTRNHCVCQSRIMRNKKGQKRSGKREQPRPARAEVLLRKLKARRGTGGMSWDTVEEEFRTVN